MTPPLKPYVPTLADVEQKIASIEKAYPYLVTHASHIDGEFANAVSELRVLLGVVFAARDSGRMAQRRCIAAAKVIARRFHDERGNPMPGVPYPEWVHEIGDILVGLQDDEINAGL